jgi:hypothetical protein
MSDDASVVHSDLEIYKREDPFFFQKFNTAQKRFLRALKNPKVDSLTIVLFLKPNRVGGSRVMMAAASAIMNGTKHPAAQCSPFGNWWPFPVRSARLLSTSETLGDTGPIQKAVKDLFPEGKYTQNRGVGKSYNSAMTLDSGWDMDTMSYGQDALSAAGSTKGLILASEPMPQPLFVECLTRLGGNGMLILECTQLDLAPYLEEMSEDAGGRVEDGIQYGSLRLDGKVVGEIRVVRGDIEESCAEHHNGHQSHSAIEATIAGWPAAEREARRTGKPLHLSGRVWPMWGEKNELRGLLPEFHQTCWDRDQVVITHVIDPADRRPWAMGYFATFPNDDVIEFAEWPPFDYAACRSSPVVNVESYRDIILQADAAIGKPVTHRLIDGLFGAAIKSGRGLNIIQMLGAPCLGCLEHDEASAWTTCRHRLSYKQAPVYSGSVRDGHILVAAAIGMDGERAKAMVLADHCPNAVHGQRKYAYKENTREDRGLSTEPQLVNKDFPDLWRMLYLSGYQKWPAEVPPTRMVPRRRR